MKKTMKKIKLKKLVIVVSLWVAAILSLQLHSKVPAEPDSQVILEVKKKITKSANLQSSKGLPFNLLSIL